ncbi:MAG TPA: YceD family protein [Xanthomonadales bacterium]|nr:YceD family protein [Xanthomonadales bacterium]
MSREFPDFVEPWRMADGRRSIGGTIPLARLKRLLPLLDSSDGDATFRLNFGYDAQQRAVVTVKVEAELKLICQTSLEPYFENVRQRSELLIISDQADQANLSEQEEFLLVDEGRFAVADLVEDELLLAVPQIPRNPELNSEAGYVVSEESGEENIQRPFESLAELMKNRAKQ